MEAAVMKAILLFSGAVWLVVVAIAVMAFVGLMEEATSRSAVWTSFWWVFWAMTAVNLVGGTCFYGFAIYEMFFET